MRAPVLEAGARLALESPAMIPSRRIASGLADSLLCAAAPDTNPEPLIETSPRSGLRPGLSMPAAPNALPRDEARHGPC